MTSDQVQQVIDALKKAGGYGWEVLVHQQVVVGIMQLIWFGLLLVLAGALVGLSAWCRRRVPTDPYGDRDLALCGVWVMRLVALCVALVGFGVGIDGFGHLLNPEGYALTALVGK